MTYVFTLEWAQARAAEAVRLWDEAEAASGTEDLRVLVGQQVGLPVADPLAEGDFYPGDLLVSVVRVPAAFWGEHPELGARLRAVVERVDLGEVDEETRGRSRRGDPRSGVIDLGCGK